MTLSPLLSPPVNSLLESSNHQDEEHSLIARYAARLASDAAAAVRHMLSEGIEGENTMNSNLTSLCAQHKYTFVPVACL